MVSALLYIPTIKRTRKADAAPSFLEYAKPGTEKSWLEGRGAIATKSSKIMEILENLML